MSAKPVLNKANTNLKFNVAASVFIKYEKNTTVLLKIDINPVFHGCHYIIFFFLKINWMVKLLKFAICFYIHLHKVYMTN